MGFVTTHVGGNDAPDGTLDAPLGPLGYRAILECKTASSGIAENVPAAEPAKFRERYDAVAAVIVAPGSKHEVTSLNELKAHDVSFWTVDELIEALHNDVDAYECRELFKGGSGARPLARPHLEPHARSRKARARDPNDAAAPRIRRAARPRMTGAVE